MSYWVEVHCDLNVEGVCRNGRNNYPMQHVSSLTRERTRQGFRALDANARRLGWQRLATGLWACPECHAHAAALRVGAGTAEATSGKK